MQILRFRRNHDSVISQRNDITAETHGILVRYLEDFDAPRLDPFHKFRFDNVGAHSREAFR